MNRFNTSKEELAKLGSEFFSCALPMLDKLYRTSLWILLDKKLVKKILGQTYSEVIEYCDKTKAYSDWQSWIYRIWIREISDFYSQLENDTQTVFDFIDFAQTDLTEVQTLFDNNHFPAGVDESKILNSLNKMPSILRIPLMLKDILLLNYEQIAELIDVPNGVIATRIYRARKLLFLFLKGNFNFEERKQTGLPENSKPIIFDIRRCALFADGELNEDELNDFSKKTDAENVYKAELLIQKEVKTLLQKGYFDFSAIEKIRGKIERKGNKKFKKVNLTVPENE